MSHRFSHKISNSFKEGHAPRKGKRTPSPLGRLSLSALAILSVTAPGFAQTPVSTSYLAIVLDKVDGKAIFVGGIDKNDSSHLFGSYDGKPVRITIADNGIGLLTLPVEPEPASPGRTNDVTSSDARFGNGNLITGRVSRSINDPFTDYEALVAWDTSGSTPVQIHLNPLAASLFGVTPQNTMTQGVATDGTWLVGRGGIRQANGQRVDERYALAWEKVGTGFNVVNLHQIAGLPSTTYSWAYGVYNNTIVGIGNGRPLRWARASNGVYTVTDLTPTALLGASGGGYAIDLSSTAIVGSGAGPNFGSNTYPDGHTLQRQHALRWVNGVGYAATDLQQASNLSATLGTQGTSLATGVIENLSVGYATSPNFGKHNPNYYNGYEYYARHAICWNTNSAGTTTFVDLHNALPSNPTTQTPGAAETEVRGMANDGTILGTASYFPQLYDFAPVLWKPLGPDANGVFEHTVPKGTTAYLRKFRFEQNSGTFSLYGTLNPPPNIGSFSSTPGYILNSGEFNGDGVLLGDLINYGGVVRVKRPAGVVSSLQITGPTMEATSYYQGAPGTLVVNVTTLGRGSFLYAGKVVCQTYASLAGSVQVNVPATVTPTIGTKFTILTANTILGTLTSTSPKWQVAVNQSVAPKTVTITYVGP